MTLKTEQEKQGELADKLIDKAFKSGSAITTQAILRLIDDEYSCIKLELNKYKDCRDDNIVCTNCRVRRNLRTKVLHLQSPGVQQVSEKNPAPLDTNSQDIFPYGTSSEDVKLIKKGCGRRWKCKNSKCLYLNQPDKLFCFCCGLSKCKARKEKRKL